MPYMAASWWLGSIAAMAASRVELGFLGSSPRLAKTIGSNLGFLGSRPSAAAVMGSSLGFLGSIPNAASSMGSSVELAAAPALAPDFPSALEVAGWARALNFLGSIPMACRVLGSMERAAIIMGSIFMGFFGSPRPSMAAVIGSSFFGSRPYRVASEDGFLGSRAARADIGFLGSRPRLAIEL